MLVLKGDEGNIQTAKNLIAELDKPIKQVRITAQVLDITNDLADELGINWDCPSDPDRRAAASLLMAGTLRRWTQVDDGRGECHQ